MSSHQPIQPFRFLELPAEIRNHFYDLLFCSWEDKLEPGFGSIVSRRCPSHPASALLRTNKQVHREACDYMLKRNQFVRITCRGLSPRDLLFDSGIPAVTDSPQAVSNFNGYVMHVTFTKPVFSHGPASFSEYEMMMLRADLPELCKRIDVESVMISANTSATEHASIRTNIKFSWAHHNFVTPKIQEQLLSSIAHLRGISDMKIFGPVDTALAKSVIEKVAGPRWTDPETTLAEIRTGVDVGKRRWQQHKYYAASESWSYALRTLERMRHSSSWRILQEKGGEEFVNNIADLFFTLHLLSAGFLQIDMADGDRNPSLVQRNGHLARHHLYTCREAGAMFARHAGSTWTPSNDQFGEMLYRHARCLRLMNDTWRRDGAVLLIEQAITYSPNDAAIAEERMAIFVWKEELDEMNRQLEEQAAAAEAQQNGGVWSNVVAHISELSA